eukprot:TRINITY_DN44090_c0_g1_i1.p1 TRINITY_DN44090_c0_g1~~TRINITY_DN44090_c0_g1_i1.p1  ORF type:complete len:335 (+),score=103.78 TRINITY_DN44090_c0_g1_i1:49-1005(+)
MANLYHPGLLGMKRDELVSTAKRLGAGSYGSVYAMKHLPTGNEYAMKVMSVDPEDLGIPASAMREVAVLLQVPPHENLVSLLAVFSEPGRLSLLFEKARGGDMEGALDDLVLGRVQSTELEMTLWSPPRVRLLSRQLLQAVRHLHACGVMHRDIKPGNILFSSADRLQIKLCDYGLSRDATLTDRMLSREIFTVNYKPPEGLLGAPCGRSGDVWATGATIAELWRGRRGALIPGEAELCCLVRVMRIFGTPSEVTWPGCSRFPDWSAAFPRFGGSGLAGEVPCPEDAFDLLAAMLVLNPAERVTAEAALQCKWLAADR